MMSSILPHPSRFTSQSPREGAHKEGPTLTHPRVHFGWDIHIHDHHGIEYLVQNPGVTCICTQVHTAKDLVMDGTAIRRRSSLTTREGHEGFADNADIR